MNPNTITLEQLESLGIASSKGYDASGNLISSVGEWSVEGMKRSKIINYKRQIEEQSKKSPTKPSIRNREELLQSTKENRNYSLKLDKQFNDGKVGSSDILVRHPVKFSTKGFDELKSVNLDQMLLNKVHYGQYLICRIISLPTRYYGVLFIIEDMNGRVERFEISKYPIGIIPTGETLNSIFSLGSIFAIREPYYKMQFDWFSQVIQCDAPTDIKFLSPNDPLLNGIKWSTPSLAINSGPDIDFKEVGNNYFRKGNYRIALSKYSEGIDNNITSPDPKVLLLLYLNRAATHINLGNFTSAYKDATKTLELLTEAGLSVEKAAEVEKKALLRKARSLDGMRLYQQAYDAYTTFLSIYPENVEAAGYLSKVEQRLRESKVGDYDFVEMLKCVREVRPGKSLALADFVGPIKVANMKGKLGGKGIIATRNIACGELLVVEKPFTLMCESGYVEVTGYCVKTGMEDAYPKSELGLISSTIAKLMENPQHYEMVNSLYAGPDYQPSPFPFQSRFREEPDVSSFLKVKVPNIDVSKIEEICIRNMFGPRTIKTADQVLEGGEDSAGWMVMGGEDSAGTAYEDMFAALYLLSSLFNHSCLPTANYNIYGDSMVIRARCSISKGEEVSISYAAPIVDFDTRARVLAPRVGPKGCECKVCEADRVDGSTRREARQNLFAQVSVLNDTMAARNIPSAQLPGIKVQLQNLMKKLENTYHPKRSLFKFDLYPIYLASSNYHFLYQLDLDELIIYKLKVLECNGVKIVRNGEDWKVLSVPSDDSCFAVCWLVGFGDIFAKNDLMYAKMWFKLAIDVEIMFSGSSVRYFAIRYEKFLRARNEKLVEDVLKLI